MTMSSAAYDQMAKEQQVRSKFAKLREDAEKKSNQLRRRIFNNKHAS